jgi:hypothetical protein
VEWGPETHNNVQVANGLFQVALGSSVALTPDVFDEALFLAVGVDGTWLTTRQPLRAVPYAFGLVPGAEVEGNPTTNYGLTVMNTGTGADDRGLYARGNQYGVWAHGVDDAGLYASSSNGTYSIRSDDTVYSSEGYAGPDTYVWVPVQNAVLDESDVSYASLSTDYYYSPLSVDAESTVISTTLVWVYIPIQVEVLYGRNYLLKNARVYYYADFDARINSARIKGCDFSGGIGVLHDIGINTTNGTSTTFAAYDIEATDYYTITASQAPTNLFISVGLPAHNSRLYLYGVRLQLESDY